LSNIIGKQTGKNISSIKHGGAAGGVAATLSAVLNAGLVNGIDNFLLLTSFEDALDKTDIVITGEGSIDLQTLQGKGPFGVAKLAKQKNKMVIGLAGQIPKEIPGALKKYFDLLLSINEEPFDMEAALKNTAINLERTGLMLGRKLEEKKLL